MKSKTLLSAAKRCTRIGRRLAAAAAATACASAMATPTPLGAFESRAFNFDATALLPIASVGFEVILSNFTAPIGGSAQITAGLDGASPLSACATNGDFVAFCPGILAGGSSNPGVLDGIFSLKVQFTGPVTVDVIALVRDSSNNVTRLREIGDTTAAVPEPGSMALALLGLWAAALGSRRIAPPSGRAALRTASHRAAFDGC